jgi:hypothetical protein
MYTFCTVLHHSYMLQIDSLLREANVVPAGEEPGPATELEYWRKQMARINSLTEQLKRRECKLVLGVCSVVHSPVSAAAVQYCGQGPVSKSLVSSCSSMLLEQLPIGAVTSCSLQLQPVGGAKFCIVHAAGG